MTRKHEQISKLVTTKSNGSSRNFSECQCKSRVNINLEKGLQLKWASFEKTLRKLLFELNSHRQREQKVHMPCISGSNLGMIRETEGLQTWNTRKGESFQVTFVIRDVSRGQISLVFAYLAKDLRLYSASNGQPLEYFKQGGNRMVLYFRMTSLMEGAT